MMVRAWRKCYQCACQAVFLIRLLISDRILFRVFFVLLNDITALLYETPYHKYNSLVFSLLLLNPALSFLPFLRNPKHCPPLSPPTNPTNPTRNVGRFRASAHLISDLTVLLRFWKDQEGGRRKEGVGEGERERERVKAGSWFLFFRFFPFFFFCVCVYLE